MIRNKKGASVTELGLLAGLIAVILIATLSVTGDRVKQLFLLAGNQVNNVVQGTVPDTKPDPFLFTALTDQEKQTFVVSETVTLSGFDDQLTLKISGDATALVRVNGASGVKSALVKVGDQIELQLVTLNGYEETQQVQVSLGSYQTGWTVQTRINPNVYYNCSSGYVVFVKNEDNLTVSNQSAHVDACKHYGFRALGTAHSSGRADLGWGTSTSSTADYVTALSCYNCHWGDQGQPWYNDHGGSGDNCTYAEGYAPAESILAGFVANSGRTRLQCATFKQDLIAGTAFGDSDTSDSTDPLYHARWDGNMDEPNCNRVRESGSDFSGTPDYLLCASPTIQN